MHPTQAAHVTMLPGITASHVQQHTPQNPKPTPLLNPTSCTPQDLNVAHLWSFTGADLLPLLASTLRRLDMSHTAFPVSSPHRPALTALTALTALAAALHFLHTGLRQRGEKKISSSVEQDRQVAKLTRRG